MEFWIITARTFRLRNEVIREIKGVNINNFGKNGKRAGA